MKHLLQILSLHLLLVGLIFCAGRAEALNGPRYLVNTSYIKRDRGPAALVEGRWHSIYNYNFYTAEDDVLSIHAQVEFSQENPDTTHRQRLQILCDGRRVSAFKWTDLKTYGNHHASLWVDGHCRASSNRPIHVKVMAQSLSPESYIHYRDQTHLIVKHYSAEPRASNKGLVESRIINPTRNDFAFGVNAPYHKYVLAGENLPTERDDILYVSAFGTAQFHTGRPNIDMFGHELLINGRRNSVSTENIPIELFRFGQFSQSLYESPGGNVEIKSRVYAANGTGLIAITNRSGIIADVYRESEGRGLLDFYVSHPQASFSPQLGYIYTLSRQYINVEEGDILKLVGHAQIGRESGTTGSCYTWTEVDYQRSHTLNRLVKPPYSALPLRVEQTIRIENSGRARASQYLLCVGNDSSTSLRLFASGSWMNIEQFR